MHTADAPLARAIASQELFACCCARKRSFPNPLPKTICMLQALANPQTRTDAEAVHDQLPVAAAGAAAAAGAVAGAGAGAGSESDADEDAGSDAGSGSGSDVGAVAGAAVVAVAGAAGPRRVRGALAAGSVDDSESAADASTSPPMARHDPPPTTSTPPIAISAMTSGEIPALTGGKGR